MIHFLLIATSLVTQEPLDPLSQIYFVLNFPSSEREISPYWEEVQKCAHRLGLIGGIDSQVSLMELTEVVSPKEYGAYFEKEIRDRQEMVLHYYRLSLLPQKLFQEGMAVSYVREEKATKPHWFSAPSSPLREEFLVKKENLYPFLGILSKTVQEKKVPLTSASVRFDEEKGCFLVVLLLKEAKERYFPPEKHPSLSQNFREVFTHQQDSICDYNRYFLKQYREKPLRAFAEEILKNKELTDKEIYQELHAHLSRLKYGKHLGSYFSGKMQKAFKEESRKLERELMGDKSREEILISDSSLHNLPSGDIEPYFASVYQKLPPGGSFILVENDAKTEEIKKLCLVAETLSDLAEGKPFQDTQTHFASIQSWIARAQSVGFVSSAQYPPLSRKGDPTYLTFVRLEKPQKTAREKDFKEPFYKDIKVFLKLFSAP